MAMSPGSSDRSADAAAPGVAIQLNGVTKTTTFTLSLPIHRIVIAPDVLVKNSTSSGMVTSSSSN